MVIPREGSPFGDNSTAAAIQQGHLRETGFEEMHSHARAPWVEYLDLEAIYSNENAAQVRPVLKRKTTTYSRKGFVVLIIIL